MRNIFLLQSLLLFAVTIFGILLQNYIVASNQTDLFYPAWKTYVFHLAGSIFLCATLYFVHKISFESTGYAFVGLTFLKMVLAIAFLYPLISSDKADYIPDVAAFFLPYFIYLTLDVIFAVRILRRK